MAEKKKDKTPPVQDKPPTMRVITLRVPQHMTGLIMEGLRVLDPYGKFISQELRDIERQIVKELSLAKSEKN